MGAQASPDTLLHWLYTNAPAAWLSALAAAVAFLLALRSRKKPRRLVVREVRNSSVVRIWPSVRHKIKMEFEDRTIKSLAQVEAEVFNEGSETIEGPNFTLTLPDGCVVLDIAVSPEEFQAGTVIDGHSVSISLPYLNAVREHKQVVKLSVLADGDTEPIKVSGSGAGWSVRHFPVTDPGSDLKHLMWLGAAVAYLLPMGIWYIPFIFRRYGIGENEMSWRALAAAAPVLVPGAVAAFASVRWSVRDVRLLKNKVR